MEEIKIRELPQKSGLSLTDLIIVEDDDGTKTLEVSEFKSLLQKSIYFNTVDDMKNAVLHEGDVVTTLGYRDINDGGGATYMIVYAPTDLNDGMLIHYLHTSDTLRAHLVHNGILNVLQCGAFGDGVSDDYSTITKIINKGFPVYFPQREYYLSGSLELASNMIIDFNNSIISSQGSSCICLGLKKDIENVTIQNATFKTSCGIEMYAYAHDITIKDCTFISPKPQPGIMHNGIAIGGASNVTVTNCVIGTKTNRVNNGIVISSSKRGQTSYGCNNISINANTIIAYQHGVLVIGSAKNHNIIISDNIVNGYGEDRNQIIAVGVQLSSNCDSVIVSSCGFSRLQHGIATTGIIDVTGAFTDIICDDVQCMYNILSDQAKIHLSGLQKFNGCTLAGNSYIFDSMTGKLYMNTVFDTSQISTTTSIKQVKTSLVGDLLDSIHPVTRDKITLIAANQLNSDLDNMIPGFINVAIDISFSNDITDLPFPSLNGQMVALYSSVGACLKATSNILCGGDIILNRYIPVILKNQNGLWYKIQ